VNVKGPKYVVSPDAFGFRYYDDIKAVGFQFLDPVSKEQVLISIDGAVLEWLIAQLQQVMLDRPDIRKWPQHRLSGPSHRIQ
jgi:hypothetical protein